MKTTTPIKCVIKRSTLVMAIAASFGSIAADDWKFTNSKNTRVLHGLDLSSTLVTINEDGLIYTSDGTRVDWRDKDREIGEDIKNWNEIDTFKRVPPILEEAKSQAKQIGAGGNPYQTYSDIAEIPVGFKPWWDEKILNSLGTGTSPDVVSPETLVLKALENSSQIQVFSDVPIIRETAELEALGAFDPVAYVDYRLNDLDEPVGSTLKTGGPDRFLEDEWVFKAGIRKKFVTGTELDISQRWDVLDNNSEFLEPKDQANARLAITLTQPLLNGNGVKYNRSLIDVARIDASIARDEFERQIESHMLELIRSYWGLYLERAVLVQRRALVERTQRIVERLQARADIDVSQVQLRRLRSEVINRKSNVVRAESAVRNAEARIVSLINDPEFRINDQFEIVPEISPITRESTISQDMAVSLALAKRSEISQGLKQLKASALRVNMTKSELRPVLNFVLGYYRDGLAAEGDYNSAFDNEFDTGDGSWTVGLVLEYPIGNRAAKARHQRRQAEARQLSNQLKTTIDTVLVEVQVSVRELGTSYREMQNKFAAMEAVRAEVQSLEDRQSVELGGNANGGAYLERLLEAHDRLIENEYEFVRSMTTYNIALANIDRATGLLMQTNDIQPRYLEDSDPYVEGMPEYKLERVNILD
ncbi:MAG: TolC family protein [Acidiferrobacterales bacterium]|nr:TolC family protein [Acidiferrobacterales bacterium]